jgi:hypothetical protein
MMPSAKVLILQELSSHYKMVPDSVVDHERAEAFARSYRGRGLQTVGRDQRTGCSSRSSGGIGARRVAPARLRHGHRISLIDHSRFHYLACLRQISSSSPAKRFLVADRGARASRFATRPDGRRGAFVRRYSKDSLFQWSEPSRRKK